MKGDKRLLTSKVQVLVSGAAAMEGVVCLQRGQSAGIARREAAAGTGRRWATRGSKV